MITQIGQTAGVIWQILDEEGPVSLTALKKQVKAPEVMVYMALGWLAREDKLQFTPQGRSYSVRLR